MIGIMCSEVHKSDSLTALSRVRVIFKVSQILLEGSRTNCGSPAMQICNLSTQSTLSSSRKHPYSPHKRDWNFQEMGFCLTKVYPPKKSIGHYRNVRGLGKSMVVFHLFEKLRYSNERSTIFWSLYNE